MFRFLLILCAVLVVASQFGGKAQLRPGISAINIKPLDSAPPKMGGWSSIDINDPGLLRATEYSISQMFPNAHPNFEIISAQSQVVAGLKYDLKVQIHPSDNVCQVFHISVWDRFGQMTLNEFSPLPDQCV